MGRRAKNTKFQRKRLSLKLVTTLVAGSFGILSCGGHNVPVISSSPAKGEESSEKEVLNASKTSSMRSSSTDDTESGGGAGGRRLEVFSGRLEPLTVQKGGIAKIVLPLSGDLAAKVRLRSVAFVSDSSGLKESSVQGKILNLVVADDALEGRHEGKILVRLENGSEVTQPISITVLP